MDFSQDFPSSQEQRSMEAKYAFASTTRRGNMPAKRKTAQISSRISRLAKKLKVANPLHMSPSGLNGTILSTTTLFANALDPIVAGDGYSARFTTSIHARSLRFHFVVVPGTTQAGVVPYRICVFRAQSGSTLANTLVDCNTTSNPIADNRMTRVFYDKLFTSGGPTAAQGFPNTHNFTVSLKNHKQQYTGDAATSTTGDSIFIAMISNVATGTAAPFISAGFFERWFQP